MAKRVVDVLVPVALDRAYSYRVPETLSLAPGDIVSVPLGARDATAVVWADNPKPNPRTATLPTTYSERNGLQGAPCRRNSFGAHERASASLKSPHDLP
jgi:3'DNA-binding domain (3'BD)